MGTPETATLSSRAMGVITAAARVMYPHDALPDAVYARVGDKLAQAAREDPEAARTIDDGVFVGPHVCFTNDKVPRAVNPDMSLKSLDDWHITPTKSVLTYSYVTPDYVMGTAELNPADEQLLALQAIEGSDFFELVRSTAVVEVYSDERTWQVCGYEGPSFDQGGYLHRGFDDLAWLPDPEQAS